MVQAGHQNEQQLLKVFSSKLMDIYYKSTSQKGKKKKLGFVSYTQRIQLYF